jgi:hypothetical protein
MPLGEEVVLVTAVVPMPHSSATTKTSAMIQRRVTGISVSLLEDLNRFIGNTSLDDRDMICYGS